MRIRQYKKFQITYNKKDKMFHAKLGKERVFTAKDENYLMELIDRDKKEQEADKKKKQHERTIKMLSGARFKLKAQDFKYFCDCIGKFTNEALVQWEGDKFYSLMYDPANVLMIEMSAPAE